MSRGEVTVRMYNVGFGDCFLVTVPSGGQLLRILIDCGTHPSSTGPRRATRDAVPALIADLTEHGATPRIDVIVATHRHKDHVAGFESSLWATVEVGEVWLPWTEDPADSEAVRILKRQSAAALALMGATSLIPARADGGELRGPAQASLALAQSLLANSLANEQAMATLHDGFLGSPIRRYLSAQADPLDTSVLPGVVVHVLAPSRDEAIMRDLDPPAGESWRQVADMALLQANLTPTSQAPFDDDWAIDRKTFDLMEPFHLLKISGQQIGAIRRAMGEDLALAAASLERSINGTSIVLALEIDDLVLLFPGDAQWGSWKSVLENDKQLALLKRASFYKIGHHGSHNATPKSFVEDVIAPGAWAALPWAKVAIWPSIPAEAMLTALGKKQVSIVRSDAPGQDNPPTVSIRGDVSVDFAFPP